MKTLDTTHMNYTTRTVWTRPSLAADLITELWRGKTLLARRVRHLSALSPLLDAPDALYVTEFASSPIRRYDGVDGHSRGWCPAIALADGFDPSARIRRENP